MTYRVLNFFFAVAGLLTMGSLDAQKGRGLHHRSLLIDTHNDCLSAQTLTGKDLSKPLTQGHSDYYRFKKGGVDVQFFSVYTGETARTPLGYYHDAIEEIDSLNRLVLRHPDKFSFATSYAEVIKRAHRKRVVAMIGVEGGHMIESDMQKLDSLAARGMRYLTLTWNNSTEWATSARDESGAGVTLAKKGLSEFGKELVRRLNQLGVIVDLSHVGEQTFYDALAVTTKPVLLTHSSVWSICPVFRNAKDDQLLALQKNGGVICINFYPAFISKEFVAQQRYWNGPGKDSVFASMGSADTLKAQQAWQQAMAMRLDDARPGIAEVADHIDYVVKLVGVDHVGIGADFDGIGFVPRGLEDVSSYPRLTTELLRRGYSHQDIKKILGKNVLRVIKANCP
ncbi:MAG: dipeptidase [Sphingomonadales bacterium]